MEEKITREKQLPMVDIKKPIFKSKFIIQVRLGMEWGSTQIRRYENPKGRLFTAPHSIQLLLALQYTPLTK